MAKRWIHPVIGLVILASVPFGRTGVWAQQSDRSPLHAPTLPAEVASPPVTAPLEERISAARSVKVVTSILGIQLGSALDEAHEKLDKLSAPGTPPKEEGGEDEKKEHDADEKREKAGDEKEEQEDKPKVGEEQEEGHKVLWQLAGTDYSAIYITADDKERIDSITGFLRPERQMPFNAVGEVSKAPAKDDNSVVWDVLRPDQPLFRVVAKGSNGKASSILIYVVRHKGVPVVHKIIKQAESDAH